jgi:hypothetical protein
VDDQRRDTHPAQVRGSVSLDEGRRQLVGDSAE